MNVDPSNYNISDGDSTPVGSPLADSERRDQDSPYYSLPDEGDDDVDAGGDADDSDDDGDGGDGGDGGDSGPSRPSGRSLLLVMVRLLTGPTEGWKSLRRGRFTPEEVAAGCFYPWCGVAALSEFACFFYDSAASLSDVVVKALGAFLSYFLGLYLSGLVLKIILPKGVKGFPDSAFGREFSMMALSVLALFHALYVALPMLQPILFFLPLWTAFIIVRGTRFVKSPVDRQSYTAGVLCLAIIGAPLLISWAFSLIS